MRNMTKVFLHCCFLVSAGLWLVSSTAQANVCSEGVALPPFLGLGADPNLLLVLDNSGSMLDMAYIDSTSQCFDESYDTDKMYAGNFDREGWYKWTDGSLPGGIDTWTSGTCYEDGALALNGGVLYEASCLTPSCPLDPSFPLVLNGCLAGGNNVGEDNEDGGVIWETFVQYEPWQNSTLYSLDDFVQFQNRLYRAENSSSSSGTSPIDDTGVSWVMVEHTWISNHSYSSDDIITYKGMLFQAKQNFSSSGTGLFDDRVGNVPTGELQWDRIDEGYFEKIVIAAADPPPTASDLCSDYSYAHTYTDSFGQTVTDIVLGLVESNGTKVTSVAQIPANVTCFTASGNFLNWASASKFDVEKMILTGGKYHAGYEEKLADGSIDNSIILDSDDDRIVSEHRGCAGRGFTKQVSLEAGSDGAFGTADDITLTLRTRGSNTGDWIDTSDNTTRMEILAVTAGGYDDAACQEVVDEIIAGASFNSISNLINTCLAGASDDERAALNHGLQYCEALRSGSARDLNTIIGDCVAVYTPPTGNISPATIQSEQGSYMCAGIFEDTLLHSDREGYMGRCWTVPSSLSCWQKVCSNACTSAPCYYEIAGESLLCAADGYEYVCTGNFNTIQKTCNKPWEGVYEDATGLSCTPTGGTALGWSDDIDGIPGGPDGIWADGACHDGDLTEGVDCECIGQAMDDYCQDMVVPEVIDPSDIASSTIDYLGLPGSIVDSGVMSQLDIDYPLATFKNYIKYQADANDSMEKPDGPQGLLYDVAPDLRLGVMAFTDNGSRTECEILATTCVDNDANEIFDACDLDDTSADCLYCNERQSISKFCPDTNGDGANIISNIELGMYVDDAGTPGDASDDFEVWDHYQNLIVAINDTSATSWTPLAEAVYTALGYFGQDTSRRLNGIDDFQIESEINSYVSGTDYDKGVIVELNGSYYQTVKGGVAAAPPGSGWSEISNIDPVQYWCQDSHILIITEGASTADVNADVATFVTSNTVDGDADGACQDGLDGSTYLDDMTWWGHYASAADLYTIPQIVVDGEAHDKQNITTHIVTTGSLRDVPANDECGPKTIMEQAAFNSETPLYGGEDPNLLESNLKAVLSGILGRASAGSAASVISSSRSGEGAVYQAIFWPKVDRGIGEDELAWIGDVHGLFIDNQGRMWDDYSGNDGTPAVNQYAILWSEDLNGNGRLDLGEDLGVENSCLDGDRRIFFFFDGENTNICFNDSAWTSDPPVCDSSLTEYCGTFTEPVAIKNFDEYLWSVREELEEVGKLIPSDLFENRTTDADGRWDWNLLSPKRYIFTWNDIDNDGVVDSDFNNDGLIEPDGDGIADSEEIIGLVDSVTDNGVGWLGHPTILQDFGVIDNTEMDSFIRWLRGSDEWYEADTNNDGISDAGDDLNNNGIRDYVYRCRRFPECVDPLAANEVINPEWRLGDVIHSTPKLVSQPAEGYHTIYRDASYAWFVKRHRFRRAMIYFGANDGMLHAVNGGFYDENDRRYWRNQTLDATTGALTNDDTGPTLGTEMWAYVPYNLQPHLKCLSDPNYKDNHKYFVDKEPRVFDLQIFEEEAICTTKPYDKNCIHPKGWGTVLVGSMRFGGSPITAGNDPSGHWSPTDNRRFISSYFILDITDPERPPTLLGEMTMTTDPAGGYTPIEADLGFTTPMPSGVVMRNNLGETAWYLIFGNGPTTIKAENSQPGKVAILPLTWLTGVNNDMATRVPFRIPNAVPIANDANAGGIYTVPGGPSFSSDLMTVDFDIETQADPTYGGLYKSDAVYFGTVDGAGFTIPNPPGDPDITTWAGGGSIYRLVTRNVSSGSEAVTVPGEWYLSKLLDTQAPVTASLSVGWDGTNYWIYFGTGRFFATEDKTDFTVQRFFGVKEPLDTSCEMTWDPLLTSIDWIGVPPNPNSIGAGGNRGLFRSDYVKVVESTGFDLSVFAGQAGAAIFCDDAAPAGECDLSFLTIRGNANGRDYYSYNDLIEYIAGEPRDLITGNCPQDDTTIGIDGWYRVLRDERERVVGQSALLGGLVTFTSYQSYADLCTAEGVSNLYGVHYQTGTAWHENVFGLDTTNYPEHDTVNEKLSLGKGLATTPSMHSGSGSSNDAKAFVQTSTGEIIEIGQENLPIKPPTSGKTEWTDDCN